MQSVSHQPAKGQHTPPPALIDGVSQQQIDDAVKAHVKGKRAAAHPVAANRSEIAMDMALTYLQTWFDQLGSLLVRDCEETDSDIASPMLDVIPLALDEIRRVQSKKFRTGSEFWKEYCRISGLCHCLAAAYDVKDTPAANVLKSLPNWAETMSGLVEQEIGS